MTLRPLVGHEAARRALARARRAGDLPAALLVHGAPGVGKQRLALWAAGLLLCSTPDAEEGGCGRCKDCRLVRELEHPDLHWFFPLPRPTGSHTPEKLADALEDARAEALAERRSEGLWSTHSTEIRGLYLAMARTLRQKAQKRPAMADRQVFIVAEAEELVPQASSPEAANALLKLLEEPPEGTFFVLTSSRPGRLLPTIRSRTFPLHLSPLDRKTVSRFLVREVGADEDEARKAARLSQGSIGRALDFLPTSGDEDGPLDALRKDSFRILQAALEGRGRGMALASDYPVSKARTFLPRFAYLEEWLRDLAAAAAGAPDRVLNQDAREYLEKTARSLEIHPVAVARALDAVADARRMASGNVNPQLIVAGLVRELRDALRTGREGAPAARHDTS